MAKLKTRYVDQITYDMLIHLHMYRYLHPLFALTLFVKSIPLLTMASKSTMHSFQKYYVRLVQIDTIWFVSIAYSQEADI